MRMTRRNSEEQLAALHDDDVLVQPALSGFGVTDFGRAQLIYKMEDGYFAASERRTDGQAVGF